MTTLPEKLKLAEDVIPRSGLHGRSFLRNDYQQDMRDEGNYIIEFPLLDLLGLD